MVVAKVKNVFTTLWDHKKKTAFAGVLVYWGVEWARKNQRNGVIRTIYAKQAITFGQCPISAELRPRRVTVLANTSANERHVWDDFTKNALPLLHLAGMEVNIIKADSESQLEGVAEVINTDEADALFVVGGDGTMQRVLTAMYKNKDSSPIPIGFGPGGYDNLALKRLAPSVFEEEKDVRRWCEAAMAVVEDTRREVAITQTTINSHDAETPAVIEFGLSPIGAGWFGHIEERRRKLWYWAGLKRRFAYFWEMLKRSPRPLSLHIDYEEFCSGCSSCRPPIVVIKPVWRWWHYLIGPPRQNLPQVKQRDFSNVHNDKCGQQGETSGEAVEMTVETDQVDDISRLRLRMASGLGRFGVMNEGWSRCKTGEVATSSREGFYQTDISARAFTLHFDTIPEFLSRVYVGGDVKSLSNGGSISVRATLKKADIFLPSSIRLSQEDIDAAQ